MPQWEIDLILQVEPGNPWVSLREKWRNDLWLQRALHESQDYTGCGEVKQQVDSVFEIPQVTDLLRRFKKNSI